MNTTQTYLDFLTSEHQGKPDLAATIAVGADISVEIQRLLASIDALLDIDNAPVGQQEDMVGACVGVTRFLNIPITGVYFSWDGTDATVGWDSGSWQPNSGPTVLSVLPDDAFLTLIRAKIAANRWDGTTEGAYAAWKILLPGFNLLIQDYQNMTFAIAIQGAPLDAVTTALITSGVLTLRPEGVKISEYILPPDTNPLFAWDATSPYLAGWDSGSWGIEVSA